MNLGPKLEAVHPEMDSLHLLGRRRLTLGDFEGSSEVWDVLKPRVCVGCLVSDESLKGSNPFQTWRNSLLLSICLAKVLTNRNFDIRIQEFLVFFFGGWRMINLFMCSVALLLPGCGGICFNSRRMRKYRGLDAKGQEMEDAFCHPACDLCPQCATDDFPKRRKTFGPWLHRFSWNLFFQGPTFFVGTVLWHLETWKLLAQVARCWKILGPTWRFVLWRSRCFSCIFFLFIPFVSWFWCVDDQGLDASCLPSISWLIREVVAIADATAQALAATERLNVYISAVWRKPSRCIAKSAALNAPTTFWRLDWAACVAFFWRITRLVRWFSE